MSCKGKFWIEEFSELFCKFDPVPLPSMSFSEQLNAVMQLFIIVGILMCVFMAISRNSLWWLGFVFMAFGGLLTVILFYSLRNMQCTENYKDEQRSRSTLVKKAARPCPKKTIFG